MPEKPPYVPSPGLVTKVLEKIKEAATPPRFTQDFLNTKLGLSGGSANLLIPYLKKIGFLNSDGTPTAIYARYRNDSESGDAAADALRLGYKSLFEVNEKAHDLGDEALKGLIVQVTGGAKDDTVTKLIFSCFKALKAKASLSTGKSVVTLDKEKTVDGDEGDERHHRKVKQNVGGVGMNLSYTINLNLPATTDIAVFNAIFQSLRKNLLRDE